MTPIEPILALETILDPARANTTVFADCFDFEHGGMHHPVYRAGAGPAVLLMIEMPGINPELWRLGNWLVAAGFTVFVPDLFAKPGSRTPTPYGIARGIIRACISREIHVFARNHASPVTQWLRALARVAHADVGGKGIGVIGMCMSGNFALTLVCEPAVIAAVASQPGLPGLMTGALHMSPEEKAIVAERVDVPILGLRFEGDRMCPRARFDSIRAMAGDRFEAIVLPDSAHNKVTGGPTPHSVLTTDLVNAAGSLTQKAVARVIEVLRAQLS
ncbi:MAG: dienelactone hydrolase [Bradymonadia bacterium]|jgi:dienelactone hydrolase